MLDNRSSQTWVRSAPWILLLALALAPLAAAPPLNAAPLTATPTAGPCAPAQNLEALLLRAATPRLQTAAPPLQLTPAAGDLLAAPPFKFRTCACSCGAPCTTDADCGLGGRCTAGITCCAAPPPEETSS